ncbi:hypothetical protein SAMN02799630_02715 [Paenibacillus sp. UNCCL117]|uniref:hypothetical protein n=1 Tax=unclassified Paenibacillus TaxID=185978 RepID=UPI00088A3299|nr:MULTISPECIES: hypothetical protein [unclassified Paenibacillus]SDD31981.1 hypothetical protein SAMN04488602_107253 [Paenibacillus sp. cl123]SFW39961.1 hypothetical protein SAMN02799630_02715 [Paenibacillus sp. UNCCL117]
MHDTVHNEPEGLEMMAVTANMIVSCRFCTRIQCDPSCRTPVHCTKWSGACSPILVNLAACMTCGEYKNNS